MLKITFSSIFVFVLFAIITCFADSVVRTHTGSIRGVKEKVIDKEGNCIEYETFKGVPYAEPPVGANRFMPPLEKVPWKQQLNTTKKYGAACPMKPSLPNPQEQNEDCLFLNIFRPANIPKGEKLPLLIWIYGGAFWEGTADGFMYDAESFMEYADDENKVIVATMNYRVGVLGFLNVDTKENPGNMGLKDQLEAIRWLSKNIEKFGGDPNRITVFGESAGGSSTHLQALNANSRKLMGKRPRYICLSGTGQSHFTFSQHPNHRDLLMEFAKKIGKEREAKENLIKMLQSVDVNLILENIEPFNIFMDTLETVWSPVVEKFETNTSFITEEPINIIKKEKPNVDVLFGHTSGEGQLFSLNSIADGSWVETAKSRKFKLPINYKNISLDMPKFKAIADEIFDFYFKKQPINETQLNPWIELLSDANFVYHINETIKLHAEHTNGKIFTYMFGAVTELNLMQNLFAKVYPNVKKTFTWHADEISYLFKCGALGEGIYNNISKKTEEIRRDFIRMITSFAATGIPKIGKAKKPLSACTKTDVYRADFTNDGVKEVKVKDDGRYKLWSSNLQKADQPGIVSRISRYIFGK